MKKIMYDFLTHLNPNLIIVRTKFGDSYRNNGDVFSIHDKRTAINSLCNCFGISLPESAEVFVCWLKTRPVYVRLENTTTDVFVPYIPDTTSSTLS
jgi:hypothetical protein